MIRLSLSICSFFFLTCFLVTSPLRGDMVNYGDFLGDTVVFQDVFELSADPLPLYGVPTVVGDSLEFLVPGFMSQSTAGGVDFLNGRLGFTVQANDGFQINSVSLFEFGSFFNVGEDSLSIANAVAFVQIGTDVFDAELLFSNSGDGTGPWSDGLEVFFPSTTEQITFVLDNNLFTNADLLGAAFISKDGLRVTVNTSAAVPEPGSAVIGGLALLLGFSRRQRKCI